MHSFVPGLDTPSYSLNDVAAAVGITTAEVKRMLTDGVISLGLHDQKATRRSWTLHAAASAIDCAGCQGAVVWNGLKSDRRDRARLR